MAGKLRARITSWLSGGRPAAGATPPGRADPTAPAADKVRHLTIQLAGPAGLDPAPDGTAAYQPPHGPETITLRTADRAPAGPAVCPVRPAAAGYRLVKHLGEGTYGTVFLAEDEAVPGLRVAIKFFAHGTNRQWYLLQDEVRQLASLDGVTGIVQLKDVVPAADPPYFVMQYAEGGSLAGRLAAGPLPPAEAVGLVAKVADALAAVHSKGIIHCDLKPANVLLDGAGCPLVADFGQAHMTGDQSPALGTFFYMAPEQADTAEQLPDTRWDVHGLGAILYALLTGGPPRMDPTLSRALHDTAELGHRLRKYRDGVRAAPRPRAHTKVPGVDRGLARIVDKCLEVDPARRYRDAGAVAAAFRARAAGRRRRPLLVTAAVATALVIGLVAAEGYRATRATLAATEARLVAQDRRHTRVTARLAADLLRAEIHARVDRLKDLADAPDVRARVAAAAAEVRATGRPVPYARCGEFRRDLDKMYAGRGGAALFPKGMTLTVAAGGNGFCLAQVAAGPGGALTHWGEDPADRAQWGTNWSWRDWFSGGGNKPVGSAPHPPIDRPYVSQPFNSLRDKGVVVKFAVPVRPPAGDAPVGVLDGTLEVDQFRTLVDNRLGVAGAEDDAGTAVLVVNDRGQYVKHPALAATLGADLGSNPPALLAGFAAALGGPDGALDRQGSADLADHPALAARVVDPATREPRPAAAHHSAAATFVPFPGADPGRPWVVVVDRDREAAAGHLAGMRAGLVRTHAAHLLVLAGLAGGLWAWLVRFLRRDAGAG